LGGAGWAARFLRAATAAGVWLDGPSGGGGRKTPPPPPPPPTDNGNERPKTANSGHPATPQGGWRHDATTKRSSARPSNLPPPLIPPRAGPQDTRAATAAAHYANEPRQERGCLRTINMPGEENAAQPSAGRVSTARASSVGFHRRPTVPSGGSMDFYALDFGRSTAAGGPIESNCTPVGRSRIRPCHWLRKTPRSWSAHGQLHPRVTDHAHSTSVEFAGANGVASWQSPEHVVRTELI